MDRARAVDPQGSGVSENKTVSIDDENDQVKEGHLVDALACTGDEGRDTLR